MHSLVNEVNSWVNKSWPCRTLQAVLDKCPDGANIHVASPTMTVSNGSCFVTSNRSYSISTTQDENIHVICAKG